MFFRKGGITKNLRPPLCNKEKKQTKQKQQQQKQQQQQQQQQKLHMNQTLLGLESTFLYLIYFLFRISWLPNEQALKLGVSI